MPKTAHTLWKEGQHKWPGMSFAAWAASEHAEGVSYPQARPALPRGSDVPSVPFPTRAPTYEEWKTHRTAPKIKGESEVTP